MLGNFFAQTKKHNKYMGLIILANCFYNKITEEILF